MEFILLPQFPLQIIVYPNEDLNLHIFEPRYRQLIGESEEKGITFGIPTFLNNRVMPMGTEIQLLSIEKKHEEGAMDIKTKGLGVYRIEQFINPVPGKLYAGATIIRLETDRDFDWNLTPLPASMPSFVVVFMIKSPFIGFVIGLCGLMCFVGFVGLRSDRVFLR